MAKIKTFLITSSAAESYEVGLIRKTDEVINAWLETNNAVPTSISISKSAKACEIFATLIYEEK